MKTRNGIYNQLEESNIDYVVEYDSHKITFTFSSQFNKNRFIERLKSSREYFNESLSKRFGCHIALDELCDIHLYSIIEKRGFLIKIDEVMFKCKDKLQMMNIQQFESIES